MNLKTLTGLGASMLLLASCRDTFMDESGALQKSGAVRIATSVDLPGRTLAANCFQCHGTNGYGLEQLAGKPANEIVEELTEMQGKNPRADIMNVHAQAYTAAELKLIGDFFAKQ